jgi:hypothetical protein
MIISFLKKKFIFCIENIKVHNIYKQIIFLCVHKKFVLIKTTKINTFKKHTRKYINNNLNIEKIWIL